MNTFGLSRYGISTFWLGLGGIVVVIIARMQFSFTRRSTIFTKN